MKVSQLAEGAKVEKGTKNEQHRCHGTTEVISGKEEKELNEKKMSQSMGDKCNLVGTKW